MACSIELKKIKKKMKKISNELRADDIRFKRCVYIIQQDGSTMFFKDAFICKYFIKSEPEMPGFIQPKIDTWIVIFTEHYGTKIYNDDDLIDYNQFEKIQIEEI